MGIFVYRACVALREWAERKRLDPLIAFGKMATAVVSRFVWVGGGK